MLTALVRPSRLIGNDFQNEFVRNKFANNGDFTMQTAKPYILWTLSAYMAFVFVQSLFFKFTAAPESIFIFTTLREWSGISLFEPVGRWVIGLAELLASVLLFIPRLRIFGAALAIGIMTGAIFFHLFTPLGVDIMGDHGELFTLACGVWLSGWIILALSRDAILIWSDRLLGHRVGRP